MNFKTNYIDAYIKYVKAKIGRQTEQAVKWSLDDIPETIELNIEELMIFFDEVEKATTRLEAK